ncbi:hypothetical protein K2173_024371 [Erythroxylum novogranatense]|uniref:KHG/KDPG aldolase n=1 Tax=Erythroxylum novogranatense TaxID=1862640 RepID=A0AAV8SU52_9ROSI|nr:hypothetical protein K2173_024371 [Erythroxylum novogranatense]
MSITCTYLSPSRWLASPLAEKLSSSTCEKYRVTASSYPQLSLSNTKTDTLSLIQSSGVIACLRATSAELAFEAASAALNGGISVLEIVMSTPGALQVFFDKPFSSHSCTSAGAGPSQIGHRVLVVVILINCIIQVGTVLSSKDAIDARNAGAKFLMSPAIVKDIMDDFSNGEVLYIPGTMTPTEILSAYNAGAEIIKVYPVSALGGVPYMSAIKKPFPHIPMVASQGITIDSVGDYISHGASAVVLSDAIFRKDSMLHRDFNAIYHSAYLASLQAKEAIQRNRS